MFDYKRFILCCFHLNGIKSSLTQNIYYLLIKIIIPPFCLVFQVDIPTLITENVAKEGLKHLEMYLSIKEKGT